MPQDQVEVTGMVLFSIPIGDYDKRISILTKEMGLVQAFVRGAKRPNSRFSAACDPMCFGSFLIYPGRSAWNLASVNIRNYFEKVKGDLEAVYYASYFLELAAYFARENLDASDQLNLLYISLSALTDGRFPGRLVRVVYELKTFVINGIYPDVFSCASCGCREGLAYLSPERGTIRCRDCGPEGGEVELLPSALYAMQYIIQKPVGKLYTFTVKEEVLENLEQVMKRLVGRYCDRPLKTASFLDGLP